MGALYTASATSTGGRGGIVKSSDGLLDLQLRVPAEMGGPGGAYTNPEQLFAAVYSSCFHGAMMAVAANKRPILNSTVTTNVSIGKNDEGFYIAVEMNINIPGIPQDEAENIVQQAHKVCPYSKAIDNNVDVKLSVTTEE